MPGTCGPRVGRIHLRQRVHAYPLHAVWRVWTAAHAAGRGIWLVWNAAHAAGQGIWLVSTPDNAARKRPVFAATHPTNILAVRTDAADVPKCVCWLVVGIFSNDTLLSGVGVKLITVFTLHFNGCQPLNTILLNTGRLRNRPKIKHHTSEKKTRHPEHTPHIPGIHLQKASI